MGLLSGGSSRTKLPVVVAKSSWESVVRVRVRVRARVRESLVYICYLDVTRAVLE